jgi:hypothetical protein
MRSGLGPEALKTSLFNMSQSGSGSTPGDFIIPTSGQTSVSAPKLHEGARLSKDMLYQVWVEWRKFPPFRNSTNGSGAAFMFAAALVIAMAGAVDDSDLSDLSIQAGTSSLDGSDLTALKAAIHTLPPPVPPRDGGPDHATLRQFCRAYDQAIFKTVRHNRDGGEQWVPALAKKYCPRQNLKYCALDCLPASATWMSEEEAEAVAEYRAAALAED